MKQLLHPGFYSILLILAFFVISCNHLPPKAPVTIAIVNYDYTGCFASGKSKIVVYSVDTFIMARLENGSGKLLATAKLNDAQMDTFKSFIKDLQHLSETGTCTTVSHYSVFLKGETITKTDNSCEWNGFTTLSDCLFQYARYLPTFR